MVRSRLGSWLLLRTPVLLELLLSMMRSWFGTGLHLYFISLLVIFLSMRPFLWPWLSLPSSFGFASVVVIFFCNNRIKLFYLYVNIS